MATKLPPKPRKFVQDEFTHQTHEDQHPEEHEHTDVNTRALVTFVVVFVVVAVLTHLFLYFLFNMNRQAEDRSPVTMLPRAAAALPPGTPPLQGVPGPKAEPRFDPNPPAEDMRLFREQNDRVLRDGAVVAADGDRKVYVIPIADAMRLALEKNIFQNEPKGPHDHQQHQQQQQQPARQQQPESGSK
jgi:hypothetical protein